MSLFNQNRKKAIAYYRHSAEDKQENSVTIQREHLHKFAQDHGIDIIHEEADEGKTGLLANRPGFNNLFDKWILNQNAPEFDYVLVYDVSRWGRFQDQDEAAFYEFRCKQRGKQVIYVARGFPQKENQFMEHLITSVERFMAGEYSRQLSNKVFYGCVKVTQQGFSAGGPPCYGMARLLLDANKKPVRVLNSGEHKSIANERVTFVPINDNTTETVKIIFQCFVAEKKTFYEIAQTLNDKKIPTAHGSKWDSNKILRILTNETYIGNRIYNKSSNRLKKGRRKNPYNEWIVCREAFPAIIEREIFDKAQARIYWLIKSQWKRGVYNIQKAAKSFSGELELFLFKHDFLKDDAKILLKKFPVLFSISVNSSGIKSWCFVIFDKIKKYKNILGVGIKLETASDNDLIDKFFLIPTNDFWSGNFLFFSETDASYKDYLVQEEELEKKIKLILREMS